jgi:hypothetical protein
MAFAAAFARPASSTFIRPGAASLWSSPRPFPASLWLAQHPTRPALSAIPRPATRAPHPPCLRAAGEPPRLRRRALAETGFPHSRSRWSLARPRLDLELRLLFSRSPLLPDEDFFASLKIELGRRAWSLEHAIGAPRLPWAAAPGADTDLNKLRARLVAEVNLGLAMVETAPVRYPRPVRNVLLARHARHIGQRLADLLAHPEAGALSDELTRLLDALRQHSVD